MIAAPRISTREGTAPRSAAPIAMLPTVSPGLTSATIAGGSDREAVCTAVWPSTVGITPSAAIATIACGGGGHPGLANTAGTIASAAASTTDALAYTSTA